VARQLDAQAEGSFASRLAHYRGEEAELALREGDRGRARALLDAAVREAPQVARAWVVLASLRQQADRARAQLPASSPARPLIDEMDQAGQRARTLCGLIHDLLLPSAAPDTAHRFA